jgi:hypothetical protein
MIAQFQNGAIVSVSATKKCGSTSLHRMIFDALNDSWSVSYHKRDWIRDSRYFNSKSRFLKKYSQSDITASCAVLRDPVSRMKSIYKHSVVSHKRTPFRNTELPGWNEFVENFYKIRQQHTNVRVHSEPQVNSIGSTGQYNKIIVLDKLNEEFPAWLNQLANTNIKAVHKKKTGSRSISVTAEQEALIREYFQEDYSAYSPYFD